MCVSGSQVVVNEEAFDWRANTELRIHTGAVEWKWMLDSNCTDLKALSHEEQCGCVWFVRLCTYDSTGTDGVVSGDR